MSKDALRSPASERIARSLLAREAAPEKAGDPATVATAMQQTCLRVVANLRDALGEDGCNALLLSALARTEPEHPALTVIRRFDGDSFHLDGVVASVEAHGVAAVTAAIEALLASVVEILGRLIGEDMAIRLIEQDGPRSRTGGRPEAP
jgi:hypothetical protein